MKIFSSQLEKSRLVEIYWVDGQAPLKHCMENNESRKEWKPDALAPTPSCSEKRESLRATSTAAGLPAVAKRSWNWGSESRYPEVRVGGEPDTNSLDLILHAVLQSCLPKVEAYG